MDFKIDTRDTFSVITPVADQITANLAEELYITVQKMRQSGSQNFIIDFQQCPSIEPEAIPVLVQLHEESYSMGKSLVYTGVKGKILTAMREQEADLVLNIAPKMVEAIDIISMEILERDLFEEEEDSSI